jgi:hypothetical protein
MTYPDGIDALVNVNATDSLAAGGHAARHNSVNTALVEVKDYLVGALGSKLDLAGGKILQVVRATDSTSRSTTSTSLVDASISVTITPQVNTSAILVLWFLQVENPSGQFIQLSITDSSNNLLSGAENAVIGSNTAFSIPRWQTVQIGRSTPATINPTTYKGRFRVSAGTGAIVNANNTGQLYAIEVSA